MKVKRTGLVLACMLLAGGGMIAQQRKQADIDLQAAIRTETVNGDLKGAIRQYENVISKYGKDRPLVATALMHMADAYRKMGDAESQKIYQRLVKEFSDQTQVAAEATRRLGAEASRRSGVLTARTEEGLDGMGSMTPDGRHFIMTDWTTGDLVIRDLSTGQNKRLFVKTQDWNGSPDQYAQQPIMSPDMRLVAFTWYQPRPNLGLPYQLHVMANETSGKQRVLIDNPEFPYYELCGWSADSKWILAMLWKRDSTVVLAWVSAADGAIRPLRSLEWRAKEFSRPRVSPDGKYIAYSALERSAASRSALNVSTEPSHIYIVAADGANSETVVTESGVNAAPIWTPDGTHILFTSDRSGFVDLWSVPLREGKPVAIPSLVKADVGRIRAIGISATGAYYYEHPTHGEGENVFVADLDPSGRLRGAPRFAIERFPGSNGRPVWSPDGNFIAFHRQPTSALFQRNVPPNLTIHSLQTGQERTIELPNVGAAGQAAWFPDSKSLLQSATDDRGRLVFYRVDAMTGAHVELLAVPRDASRPAAFSRDGKTVYTTDTAVNGGERQAVRAIDLATGQVREIFSAPGSRGALPHVAVSPDGRTLAMLVFARTGDGVQESVSVIGVDGSNFRNVYTAKRGELHNPARPALPCVAWSRDGHSIFFPRNVAEGWELMRISVNGGQPESTALKGKRMNCMDISPDGSRMLFGDGRPSPEWEVLTLDNIASTLKSTR
jgi:Tol biopolymer transport system component